MRCDPSNGYILLYTCGPGTNSFSHASVYLVKEKVLSLVLINEHVHVWKVDEDTQVQLQASELDWTATCKKTPHITKQGAAVYDYVVTQLICLQMVWQQWCVPCRTSVFLFFSNSTLRWLAQIFFSLASVLNWHLTWQLRWKHSCGSQQSHEMMKSTLKDCYTRKMISLTKLSFCQWWLSKSTHFTDRFVAIS